MYEKRLLNRTVRYFRYAPPLTHLDDTTDDDRPKPPFTGAPLYMCSVYYYWWAFLKLNTDYISTCAGNGSGACSDLYADFGDVRGDDFMRWWKHTGRDLFAEPIGQPITVITHAQQLRPDAQQVVLSIPVTGDINRTLAELRKLLMPLYRANKDNTSGISKARYQVHTKPVLSSLHKQWVLWQAKRDNPSANLSELADIVRSQSTGARSADSSDYDYATASAVSRSLALASALIENVGKGRFPDNGRSVAIDPPHHR